MCWRRPGLLARLAIAVATVAWPVVAGAQVPADPYAACREQFSRAPLDYEPAYCFYRVTLEQRRWDDGERVFAELIARHPQNPWLVLAHGHVHRTRAPDRAERLYRRAAAAFQAASHVAGEAEARSNLASFLRPKGRGDEARREVERVIALAASSPDPLVKAQAWILEAAHVQETGGDLGVAYRLLKQAQDVLPDSPPYLRERALLIALGSAAFRMGRLEEALATYRRLEALALSKGEALVLANARYNIFNTSEAMESVLPTPGARQRLTHLAQAALTTATAAPNLDITLKSHRALADLLSGDEGTRPRALEHAQQCLALAVAARQPSDEAACAWIAAALQARDHPRVARAAEQRAVEATGRDNNPRTQAHSAGRQMRLSWRSRSRAEAIRDALAGLTIVETLRALQDDARSSADLFSSWTADYYWFAGRLLEGDRPDVSLAFAVTERMRARSLLDALARSRQPLDPGHPAVVSRRAFLERIATVQRVLMDPATNGDARRRLLQELERLERDEQEAARQVALAFPGGRTVQPTFASLDAVQAALARDQALLSFQVGLWKTYGGDDGGGSWLTVVTSNGSTTHRLPDRTRLAAAVPMFTGLLESGQSGEAVAAAALYRALLAEAIAALPAGITRLVIVADGALHHLPFEALRASPESAPLAARFEIALAPSATLWQQWRLHGARNTSGRVLALADPATAVSSGSRAPTRNATLLWGVQLGGLPHARAESRAIARHVGSVDVLVGPHASERAVKARTLRDYDVLHLAAHAVADESHPERSAVMLAPGGSTEDGLLQAREIAALDTGDIVVLSACRTAAGAVQSGEGVLSLARAFFEGGAQAVIGSRWPIRDADASALFDAFYRHLAGGASLSEAVARTREEARAQGRPASAWAGLVLLGNGDLRPFAGGRLPSRGSGRSLVPLVVAITCVVGLLAITVARRSTGRLRGAAHRK